MPKKSMVYTILNSPHHLYLHLFPTISIPNAAYFIYQFRYPQCRLPICRKFYSCPWFLKPLSAVCAVYIYMYIYCYVSCCWIIKEGEEGGEAHTTMSQLNSCFWHYVSREELNFQNGAQTLPSFWKKDPMKSVIPGGTYSYVRGRGSWGSVKGVRGGMRYHKATGVLGFYTILTRSLEGKLSNANC